VKPASAHRLKVVTGVVVALVAIAGLSVGWFYGRLRASLPQLDGTAAVAGLGAAVTIERDALGVPTIRGANRVDVARALGWLHGQDRYFQMDLLRRNSAGELAALFGARALPHDRAVRMHGFRRLAAQALAGLSPGDRAIVEAYAAGVNDGLRALRAAPFEYLVLRQPPEPWQPEDTFLVSYTMTLDLQDSTGRYEKTLMTLRDELGRDALAFFAPLVTPDDAALDGSTAPLPPIPGPKVLDLRPGKTAMAGPDLPAPRRAARVRTSAHPQLGPDQNQRSPFAHRNDETIEGSNSFALAGAHTANGAPLLANDMHLDHNVPNIWYRASLVYGGRRVTGVTIPGAPLIVAGSNGHVAWGFTDAYADTGDLVEVETSSSTAWRYTVPGAETREIEHRHETIAVKGAAAVAVDYDWTIWGPIVGQNEREHPLAFRWVAHDPAAMGLCTLPLEAADDVPAALAAAHRAGMPAQNILIVDTAGHFAWTIAGRIPARVGFDGRLPVSWAFGDRRWPGLLPPDDVPALVDPPAGRLWTANNRIVGGEALAKLGDGGYARPNRAAQIRDDLAALERAVPRDLLAVQLDDRAKFLTPWHELLMRTLTPAVAEQKRARAKLRGFAENWEGRASVEAVSYPIVKQFRLAVYDRVFSAIFASCTDANPGFNWRQLRLEPAIWALLREKPLHLLNPAFKSWDELLVAAIDDTIVEIDKRDISPPRATWGVYNRARIRHPFSYTLPAWLTGWLNMPDDELPGDVDMPRVQQPSHGASERFVVSPGHEAEGIFHMPGGQSAHPLSPYYRAGHEAWVHGDPTPFLPGKTDHTLTLKP